jgi:large subunit ribosomal protein L5
MYVKEIVPRLMKEGGYRNPMEVPRLVKIVLNIGLGEAIANSKAIEAAQRDLATIAGQRAVVTKAKKSVSAFKVRQGMPIGAMVTLRGNRMYEFFDRLVNAALPRIRDFGGTPVTSFDSRGNYALGLREQLLFPEIEYTTVDKPRGLQVNVVTTARNREEAKRFLELLGMPFSRDGKAGARTR